MHQHRYNNLFLHRPLRYYDIDRLGSIHEVDRANILEEYNTSIESCNDVPLSKPNK